MSDLMITWIDGEPDLAFEDGDLVGDDSLEPAVAVSLFTDARALASDELPDGTTNRRGFWGDSLFPEAGAMGSRLWLQSRGKETSDELQRAYDFDLEALQWLLDGGDASALDVTVTAPERGAIQHQISITTDAVPAPDVITLIAPGEQIS